MIYNVAEQREIGEGAQRSGERRRLPIHSEETTRDIKKLVLDFEEIMIVTLISYAFLLKQLMGFIYSRLKLRSFEVNKFVVIELAAAVSTSIFLYKFVVYSKSKINDLGIEGPDKEKYLFFDALIEDKIHGFRIDWVLAFLTTSLWLKVIFMLEQTSMFGPTLRIISIMAKELGVFLVFWFLELIIWCAFGILLFGQLEAFYDMETAFLTLFNAAFANWDFEIFAELNTGKEVAFGTVYLLCFILFNSIILLNLVIAILGAILGMFRESTKGMY